MKTIQLELDKTIVFLLEASDTNGSVAMFWIWRSASKSASSHYHEHYE